MSRLADQPFLQTERLWLAPLRRSDAPAVFAYSQDPRVAEHVTWSVPESVAESARFVDMACDSDVDHYWAIRTEAEGPARGLIEFGFTDDFSASVHYVLAAELWGRGLMSEVVQRVVDWAFDAQPSLQAVVTTVVPENVGSRRVLEKCGFVASGRRQETWTKSDDPVTLDEFTLPRSEWTRRRATRPDAF